MRHFAIKSIIDMLLNIVLGNRTLFTEIELKNTLYIFAQLIDWNELS